jgi:signal transduction histidine kinase
MKDEGTGLTVTVTDDGLGIGSPCEQAGHGIDNMRTRSRLIGARFEIGSGSAAGGTRIKLMLPHNASRHQE